MDGFKKILVTDASERSSLSIIRSLGKRGLNVVASDFIKFSAGALSKYSRNNVIYPPPQNNIEKFLRFFRAHLKNNNYDLVIPAGEFTSLLLSKNKEVFEKYATIAIEDYDTFLKSYDKYITMKIAKKLNVPFPRTFAVNDVYDLKNIACSANFPLVIKPRSKSVIVGNRIFTFKITEKNYIESGRDLIDRYTAISRQFRRNYMPLIQEYAVGEEYGAEFLFDEDSPKAFFVHKRLRTYPVTGGASTLREGVVNRNLIRLGSKLLKGMKWHGAAMVEFKLDPATKRAKLIEVNGRFWGSLPLAISSGVDFPYLCCKLMQNENFKSVKNYKTGIRQRWLIPGDLMWLFSSLGGDKKIYKLCNFMKSTFVKDDIISMSDPMPTIGSVITSLKYISDVLHEKRGIEGEYL
jgi:predicted ATP-grasp superfamily ATP-dependent carboligase